MSVFIRSTLFVSFLSPLFACDLGRAPEDVGGDGQVAVRIAAFRDLGLRAEYDVTLWQSGPGAGDPMEEVVVLTDLDGENDAGDYSGVHACKGNRAGMAQVAARIIDADSGAVLESFADTKLFYCQPGKVAALAFRFQSQHGGKTGFADVTIQIDDVEYSCGSGIRDADGKLTAITGLAVDGEAMPDVDYIVSATGLDGSSVAPSYDVTEGTTVGDGPLSYFDVEIDWSDAPQPIAKLTARAVLSGEGYGCPTGFSTGCVGPSYQFELGADGTVQHSCGVTRDVARTSWLGADLVPRTVIVNAAEPVAIPSEGGGGFKEGGARIDELAGKADARTLATTIYYADPIAFPKGITPIGAIDFDKGALGVVVEATQGQHMPMVIWCMPALDATTFGCETGAGDGFLVMHSIEDSLARAGATQGQ